MVTAAPAPAPPSPAVERPAPPGAAAGIAREAAAAAAARVRAPRRLRRVAAFGPRCPDCAGPLAFGEGCSLCPVCGYSRCSPGA